MIVQHAAESEKGFESHFGRSIRGNLTAQKETIRFNRDSQSMMPFQRRKRPNKAPEPTTMAVTPRATS